MPILYSLIDDTFHVCIRKIRAVDNNTVRLFKTMI